MPRDERGEGLPPPMRGARMQPEMTPDRGGGGGTYGKLSKLAEGGAQADAGGEDQAAQLVMSAAQQLIQAAQMHPAIQEMVGRALAILKAGVDELAGGGGMGGGEEMGGEFEEEEKKPKKKKRVKPPTAEPQEDEMGMMGGY